MEKKEKWPVVDIGLQCYSKVSGVAKTKRNLNKRTSLLEKCASEEKSPMWVHRSYTHDFYSPFIKFCCMRNPGNRQPIPGTCKADKGGRRKRTGKTER